MLMSFPVHPYLQNRYSYHELLAGGQGERLYPLTKSCVQTGSVPFGGKYRIIDFALSPIALTPG